MNFDLLTLTQFNEIVFQHKTMHKKTFDLHIGHNIIYPQLELEQVLKEINQHSQLCQYPPLTGITDLKQQIYQQIISKNHSDVSYEQIIITNGATQAIDLTLRSILQPGDEVIILAPYWPYLPDMIQNAAGKFVSIDFYNRIHCSDFNVTQAIDMKITKKTKAIYLNSPNNPSGIVLNKSQLLAIQHLAQYHYLWLILDNTYEDIFYQDDAVSCVLHGEKVIHIHSFSKIYGLAGLRLGYIISPDSLYDRIKRLLSISTYSVNILSQLILEKLLQHHKTIMVNQLHCLKKARNYTTEKLIIPHLPIQGGIYVFLDLSSSQKCIEFIKLCMESAVFLARGNYFGDSYAQYARLCFTALKYDELEYCISKLNQLWMNFGENNAVDSVVK